MRTDTLTTQGATKSSNTLKGKCQEIIITLVLIVLGAVVLYVLSKTKEVLIIPVASAKSPPVASVWSGYEVLKRVLACESTGDPNAEPRQFEKDGSILWGKEKDPKTGKVVVVKRDCGMAQINSKIHAKELSRLGLDVCGRADDNFMFAKILFKREGLKPWLPSVKCWSIAIK